MSNFQKIVKLTPGQLRTDCARISMFARNGEPRLITLNEFVLLSNGQSAFIIEIETKECILLLHENIEQKIDINEQYKKFSINWPQTYVLTGESIAITQKNKKSTVLVSLNSNERRVLGELGA